MTPLSSDEAILRYPHLAKEVIAKLAQAQQSEIDAAAIAWHAILCHDDPEQPLDEAACADVMLTGRLPCRHGLCGTVAGHYACFCEEDCAAVDSLSRS